MFIRAEGYGEGLYGVGKYCCLKLFISNMAKQNWVEGSEKWGLFKEHVLGNFHVNKRGILSEGSVLSWGQYWINF